MQLSWIATHKSRSLTFVISSEFMLVSNSIYLLTLKQSPSTVHVHLQTWASGDQWHHTMQWLIQIQEKFNHISAQVNLLAEKLFHILLFRFKKWVLGTKWSCNTISILIAQKALRWKSLWRLSPTNTRCLHSKLPLANKECILPLTAETKTDYNCKMGKADFKT